MKTASDLLSDGFKGGHTLLEVLGLGDTNIALYINEHYQLKNAIENKDYFEIKNIVKGLRK